MVLVAVGVPVQVERMFKPKMRHIRDLLLQHRMGMLTRGKDINTLAVVGEVGPVITQSGSTNGNSLLSSGGGVGAGIPVVVTGSDSEVHARLDGPIHGIVQSHGLTATQGHVGNGTLVFCLSGGSVLSLGSGELTGGLLGGPQNTTNNISHSATSVGAQDLDGNEIDCLGNAVLARTDGTGAVGPVTVTVLVDVILRDGLAPRSATLKLDVVDVDTGIDDVHVNALTAGRVVLVESEGSKTELSTVGDTRKTLAGKVITNHATRAGLRNVPMEQSAECQECEQ